MNPPFAFVSAKSTLAMAKVAPENSPRSRVRFCGAFAGLCGRARKLTPALVIKFFKELDEDVVDNLADGSIRLVSADYLRSGEMKHVRRRQDLEAEEKRPGAPKIFLTAREAKRLWNSHARKVGVLTYGWNSPDDPDPTEEYLNAVVRFLNSEAGAHIVGIFWE